MTDRWFPIPGYRSANGRLDPPHRIYNERGEHLDEHDSDDLDLVIRLCDEHNSSTPGRRQSPYCQRQAPNAGGRASIQREGTG